MVNEESKREIRIRIISSRGIGFGNSFAFSSILDYDAPFVGASLSTS